MELPKHIQHGVFAIGDDITDLNFLGDGVVRVLDLVVEIAWDELGHGFEGFGVVDFLFEELGGEDGGLFEAADLLHFFEALLHLDGV